MSKTPRRPAKTAIQRGEAGSPSQAEFDEVLALIDAAKARAFAAVNTTLIELYWNIGQYIGRKIAEEGWGQGTVEVLAETIRRRYPTIRGFSQRNLWRMRQFFETYRGQPKLAALLRIVVEPQPGDHESMQARRGTRTLPPPRRVTSQ